MHSVQVKTKKAFLNYLWTLFFTVLAVNFVSVGSFAGGGGTIYYRGISAEDAAKYFSQTSSAGGNASLNPSSMGDFIPENSSHFVDLQYDYHGSFGFIPPEPIPGVVSANGAPGLFFTTDITLAQNVAGTDGVVIAITEQSARAQGLSIGADIANSTPGGVGGVYLYEPPGASISPISVHIESALPGFLATEGATQITLGSGPLVTGEPTILGNDPLININPGKITTSPAAASGSEALASGITSDIAKVVTSLAGNVLDGFLWGLALDASVIPAGMADCPGLPNNMCLPGINGGVVSAGAIPGTYSALPGPPLADGDCATDKTNTEWCMTFNTNANSQGWSLTNQTNGDAYGFTTIDGVVVAYAATPITGTDGKEYSVQLSNGDGLTATGDGGVISFGIATFSVDGNYTLNPDGSLTPAPAPGGDGNQNYSYNYNPSLMITEPPPALTSGPTAPGTSLASNDGSSSPLILTIPTTPILPAYVPGPANSAPIPGSGVNGNLNAANMPGTGITWTLPNQGAVPTAGTGITWTLQPTIDPSNPIQGITWAPPTDPGCIAYDSVGDCYVTTLTNDGGTNTIYNNQGQEIAREVYTNSGACQTNFDSSGVQTYQGGQCQPPQNLPPKTNGGGGSTTASGGEGGTTFGTLQGDPGNLVKSCDSDGYKQAQCQKIQGSFNPDDCSCNTTTLTFGPPVVVTEGNQCVTISAFMEEGSVTCANIGATFFGYPSYWEALCCF